MITLKQVGFSYRPETPLFSDLNISFTAEHIYGLLGKNGAGKTTLLKLLSGLLYAQQGEISALALNPAKRAVEFLREIYFIPEEIDLPEMTVHKFETLYAPFYPQFSTDCFKTHLDVFEINKAQSLSSLSYGQKKKVVLAFGLAANTKILILDEPTNGLDIPSKSGLRKLLAAYPLEERCIIISTHQVRELENLIDAVAILEAGKVILQATTAAITEAFMFEKSFEKPDKTRVIYSEAIPAGYLSILKNDFHEESNIQLELLFNAVLANPAIFQPKRGAL